MTMTKGLLVAAVLFLSTGSAVGQFRDQSTKKKPGLRSRKLQETCGLDFSKAVSGGTEYSMKVELGRPTSYIKLTVGDGPFQGVYNTWCIDHGRGIGLSTYKADIVNVYDASLQPGGVYYNAVDKPENLKAVAYLINNFAVGDAWKGNSCNYNIGFGDLQNALWNIIDMKNGYSDGQTSGYGYPEHKCVAEQLAAYAIANGKNYELDCADPFEQIPMVFIVDDSSNNIRNQVLMGQFYLTDIPGLVTEPPPEPEPKTTGEECETAFAYSPDGTCFLDPPIDMSRWGWTIPLSPSNTVHKFDVYAGAGQCDRTKGALVGELDVTYDGSAVQATYVAAAGFAFSEVHLYAGCKMLPQIDGVDTVAPGQYTIVDNSPSVPMTYSIPKPSGCTDVYVIAHAVSGAEGKSCSGKALPEPVYSCPVGSSIVNIDFNGFSRGQYVDQLTSTVKVKAAGKYGKGYTPDGKARIFDSSNPTGGDIDLGSPNAACNPGGGPGEGDGGRKGRPGANCKPLGNLLIIQSSNAADPNDLYDGGKITFSTDGTTEFFPLQMGILDAESGVSLLGTNYPGVGNNGFQELSPASETFVKTFDVDLANTGGIAYATLCEREADLCPMDDSKTKPGVCGCGVADVDTDKDGTMDCNDRCPTDPTKTQPGVCGCGVSDKDTDGDGVPDCKDLCPMDPDKIAPGVCGCGESEMDTDGDGTPDCADKCASDPLKTEPGKCGCGMVDNDSDGDGIMDCNDLCPNSAMKTTPGICGCDMADIDSDGDGSPDCKDGCKHDPNKVGPGVCGCHVSDVDTDGDGTPDCKDNCPMDAGKTEPGACGCGVSDKDSDNDGTPDCEDQCPMDAGKTDPGVCGCGKSDVDTDGDGTPDCIDKCPMDANKTGPGVCGCGKSDVDTDGDGTADCKDACPTDPNKVMEGTCGCGNPDTDSDQDGTPDCVDQCPMDAGKTEPELCGCGKKDWDTDMDGTLDCFDNCPGTAKADPGICGCDMEDVDTDGDGAMDCVDGCSTDPNKTTPGVCGCGVPDVDADNDGVMDCNDGCSSDPNKAAPGICGCGTPDTDSDGDGTPDCHDNCPMDGDKTEPGSCGCGTPDTDSDGDGTPDCLDKCPMSSDKTDPGVCGCDMADTDSDGDGTPDCNDGCPEDADKVVPGKCGCGVSDMDTDGDGTPDCKDECIDDPLKTKAGTCGCGVADTDSDSDGTPDCIDSCPMDATKTEPGVCGCGVSDKDSDGDGRADCEDDCPYDMDKTEPGTCGCGVKDVDTDGDGIMDCFDSCSSDSEKDTPGVCGCGTPDTDSDGDGVPDCIDNCPMDGDKTEPGSCGCGTPDTDSDGDGTPDCLDKCPVDPNKTEYGSCGCGIEDTDSDGDGTPDCKDLCPNFAGMTEPGTCGCGIEDIDTDGDGVFDCEDLCPMDAGKTEPGFCGCGVADTDSDGDGMLDCDDLCPGDMEKTEPGECGCGIPDTDANENGIADCLEEPEDKTITPPGKGSGSGDPHFKTWTGDKYDYHGECDLVLLDHPTFNNGQGLSIHIRTTRVKYFSYIEKVAVRIGADVLEFDNDVQNFFINGELVGARIKHHKDMLGGFWIRRDPKALSIRLLDLGRHHHNPGEVAKIDLHTRKNGFPAVIVDGGNTNIFKGSLGLLGDWSTGKRLARDGETEMNDPDATAFALEWQVRDTEPMLFKEARFPQYPTTCTPPAKMDNRVGMASMRKEAEKACAHWKEDVEDCIFDVIATRDVLVAEEGHIVHLS